MPPFIWLVMGAFSIKYFKYWLCLNDKMNLNISVNISFLIDRKYITSWIVLLQCIYLYVIYILLHSYDYNQSQSVEESGHKEVGSNSFWLTSLKRRLNGWHVAGNFLFVFKFISEVILFIKITISQLKLN